MLKSITVINHRDEQLFLELSNPYDTGLIIKDITGIGPVKANINTTELAISDGSIFNSARATSRNIVFSFQLVEDKETNLVETVRQRTYKYFPLKKMLTLIFETDNRIAAIQGYVESNEPDIFQKDETIQVSIVCPSPYFYTPDSTIVLNGVESMFMFPFSNESLEEDLICMGNIVSSISMEYVYDGDVESGVIFYLHCMDHVEDVTVYNMLTRERMQLDTSVVRSITGSDQDGFIAGDDIYLSTISGDRYITLVRGGKEYNILPCIPKITDWITVQKGSNVFGYHAAIGKSNMSIEVHTNVLYEGV